MPIYTVVSTDKLICGSFSVKSLFKGINVSMTPPPLQLKSLKRERRLKDISGRYKRGGKGHMYAILGGAKKKHYTPLVENICDLI